MSKNTGDGELDSIHANSIKGLDCPACGHPCLMLIDGYITCTLAECPNPDYAETAAQEANKAQRQLLQGLMEQRGNPADYVGVESVVPKSVIQNMLEGLS